MDKSVGEDVPTLDASALPYPPLLPSFATPSSLDLPTLRVQPSASRLVNQAGRLHSPSDSQWEEIRILTDLLYIKEDRSLNVVLEYLRKEKSFRITKNQLVKRLKPWGLRKHANAEDIKSFLRKSDGQIRSLVQGGRKISRARFDRWQREKGKRTAQPPIQARSGNQNPLTIVNGKHMDEDAASPSEIETPPPVYMNKAGISEVLEIGHGYIEGSQSFPSDMDLNKFAKLSDLFKALKIKWPTEFTAISLPPLGQTSGTIYQHCISNSELLDLRISHHRRHKRDQRAGALSTWKNHSLVSTSAQYNLARSPLKFPHVDFLLPQGDDEEPLQPSPLNEMFTFTAQQPYHVRDHFQNKIPSQTLSLSQISEIKELNDLNLQGPLSPDKYINIMSGMESYAHECFNVGNYQEAEYWYQRVLKIREITGRSNSTKTILTAIDLMYALNTQSKFQEATELHAKFYQVLRSHPKRTEDLCVRLLKVKSKIPLDSGHYKEAEQSMRELLQLAVHTYGLRHPDTLEVLINLGRCLYFSKDLTESQNLLSIGLELQDQADEEYFQQKALLAMLFLAQVLLSMKRLPESETLSRMAVERASKTLRENDRNKRLFATQLAKCLHKEGKFEESVEVQRKVVEYQLYRHGQDDRRTLESILELGRSLYHARRYSEAQNWLKISFKGLTALYGPGDYDVVTCCNYLARCYTKQEQYDKALSLYEEHMEVIGKAVGYEHSEIKNLRSWVDSLRRYMRRVEKQYEEFVNFS